MEPQTAQKKSIFKNFVTYIVIVVITLALVGGYLLLQTFIKEQTETITEIMKDQYIHSSEIQ